MVRFVTLYAKDKISLSRMITKIEDEDSYEKRILKRDYDTTKYNVSYDAYILAKKNNRHYDIRFPPRQRKEYKEIILLRFNGDKVKQVSITNDKGTFIIDYDGYPRATYNGKEHELAISKELYSHKRGNKLHYHGVALDYIMPLPEYDAHKRVHSDDVVLGFQGIPLFIATISSFKYDNIRPYNAFNLDIFRMLLPFELQPDLPNVSSSLATWLEGMRYLIQNHIHHAGLDRYLERFFGKVRGKNHGTIMYTYDREITSMRIRHESRDAEHYTYLHKGVVKIMTEEPDTGGYHTYILGDENNPYIMFDGMIDDSKLVYIGNEQYERIYLSHQGCFLSDEQVAKGYGTRCRYDPFYPTWDAMRFMQEEDVSTFYRIKEEHM